MRITWIQLGLGRRLSLFGNKRDLREHANYSMRDYVCVCVIIDWQRRRNRRKYNVGVSLGNWLQLLVFYQSLNYCLNKVWLQNKVLIDSGLCCSSKNLNPYFCALQFPEWRSNESGCVCNALSHHATAVHPHRRARKKRRLPAPQLFFFFPWPLQFKPSSFS